MVNDARTSGALERFVVHFKAGEMIFCEYEPGDSFYLIQAGRVRLTKIVGDMEKNVDILHPGEIFGEMAILEEAPRLTNAIAIEDVSVLQFDRANFSTLLTGRPQIALRLLRLFTKRIYDQRRRFMTLMIDDPKLKVVDTLLMLDEIEPCDNPEQPQRVFHTTAVDIARWAAIPIRESKRILHLFAEQRKIEIKRTCIVVSNINYFSRMANAQHRQ